MCEKIEGLLGRGTIQHVNPDTNHTSLHGRHLLTADEIRRLERNKIILYISESFAVVIIDEIYCDVKILILVLDGGLGAYEELRTPFLCSD